MNENYRGTYLITYFIKELILAVKRNFRKIFLKKIYRKLKKKNKFLKLKKIKKNLRLKKIKKKLIDIKITQ